MKVLRTETDPLSADTVTEGRFRLNGLGNGLLHCSPVAATTLPVSMFGKEHKKLMKSAYSVLVPMNNSEVALSKRTKLIKH